MHMNFYKTTNPDDYGLYFYKQIGLNCTFEQLMNKSGRIRMLAQSTFMVLLMRYKCGTGDYTIPADSACRI